MNFDRLKSDGSAAGTALAAPEARAVGGESLWWPDAGSAGVAVTARTALRLSPFFAAVNVVASDTAILPLDVYQAGPGGGRRKAREHPASELLSRSPDGRTVPARWVQAWVGHALEHGNGYAEIQRKNSGRPYALHLLDPETTRAEDDGGRPGYRHSRGWLEAANVLHIAGLGYDGLTGYHLVDLLREAIGVGLAAQGFSADYFSNGSEPNGVIETPERLGKAGRAELADGWAMRHGGPGQRHRVAVLEKGAKWNGVSTDPEKSQLLETRRYQALEAVRPTRVPPHKIGDMSESHLANIEASNLDYLQTALLWWLTGIEQECNLKLFTRAEWLDGYYVEHNLKALLRADSKTRFESYGMALRDGWMSRNDVHRFENMNPIPAEDGGDLYTVQAQMVPLGQAGGRPAPAQARGERRYLTKIRKRKAGAP